MAYSYKGLVVWQKSIELVFLIYKFTESFPKSELYGLTNQIRRAAVSIPANIAEGSARDHRKEYCQFVKIAYASGAELETHITVAKRLHFGNPDGYKIIDQLLEEIMRMTNALARRLAGQRLGKKRLAISEEAISHVTTDSQDNNYGDDNNSNS